MNGLQVEAREGVLHFGIRVSPGARNPRVVGLHGGALKVAVAEPPEKGRANAGVIRVLAAALGVPAKQIELVSGHTSRDKRVAVTGLSAEELAARVTALVNQTG